MTDTRTWAYHHTCKEGCIYPDKNSIPAGWVDSPAKVEAPKKRGRPKKNVDEDLDVQGGEAKDEDAGNTAEEPEVLG